MKCQRCGKRESGEAGIRITKGEIGGVWYKFCDDCLYDFHLELETEFSPVELLELKHLKRR